MCCWFGAVDARANGTLDQCTRATKKRCAIRNHREHGTNGRLSTAKVEVLDNCHPRTWKCWTLSPTNLELKKNERGFSVARSGSRWLFVTFLSFSVARSGSPVAFGKNVFFIRKVVF